MTRTLIKLPDQEVLVICRLNFDSSDLVDLIESLLSKDKGVAVATTLNRPKAKKKMTLCCMNLRTKLREL